MAQTVMQRPAFGPARPASGRRSNRKLQLAVVALVLVAAVGYLVYSGLRTNVYYQTVNELQAAGAKEAGRQVRVAGDVAVGSIVKEDSGSVVHFTITDGSGSMPVVYQGAIPDIFQPGIQVVVEGKYHPGGEFQATTLLAKCPSKFQAATPVASK